jgi:cobalt/nickel transport system permease protein
MHIPDGFLSTPVWVTLDAAAIPAVLWAARRAQIDFDGSAKIGSAVTKSANPTQTGNRRAANIPLLGVMGAFVMAAQMINFPVGIGTSGHLVGGALLAIALGPAAASIVMTAILILQALVFQDGGVLALGANILNMAFVGVLAAWLPYRLLGGGAARKPAIFLAGFLSVLVSASLALTELLLSGVPVASHLLWISGGLFTVSALLEGAITLATVGAIERLNPSWIPRAQPVNRRAVALVGTAAIALVVIGVGIASSAPDGIMSLLSSSGLHASTLHPTWNWNAPLADYQAAISESAWTRKAAAGLAGLTMIYLACLILGRWITRGTPDVSGSVAPARQRSL